MKPDKQKIEASIFESTFESVADGILVTDITGKPIVSNKQLAKMWNIADELLNPPEENILLKKTLEQLKDPDAFMKNVISVRENPELQTSDVLELKDGRIFERNSIPRIMNGKSIGRVWTYRDITKQKQAEEALKRNEGRLRALIEHSWDVFELIDSEGNILYISPAAANISGYEMDELKGRNVFEAMADEYREYAKNLIAEISKRPRQTYSMNLKSRRKDGEMRWIEGSCTNLLDDPNINAIVVNYHDITDLKNAVEALQESEKKYRVLVENASEGIIVVQDSKIKYANPKITQLFGYSQEDIMGSYFAEFIHPDDRDQTIENYNLEINGKDINDTMTIRVFTQDGNIKWAEIKSVLIKWEGKPAIHCFINDITEKRKMEEELLRMQKLESIGTLAGGLAHDFNNILTGIMGNISLTKMLIDQKEKASERLAEAEKAAYKAKDLTSQLLTFSKGGTPILKVVSISDILREATDFALSGSKSKYSIKFDKDLWHVIVDESQINQVISNIVINADQAMPQGGLIEIKAENIVIKEGTKSPLKPGYYVKISFKDYGIGIPKEYLSRIFDPYFTTKQKGSGLGLAISYSIIKKHEGHIEVISQLGHGSTFLVFLPASPEQSTDKGEKEYDGKAHGIGKILIMDDAEIIKELLSQMLSQVGYDVAVASEGAEAIEKYLDAMNSDEPFDAVIMDLTIPGGMGGIEAISKLREFDTSVKAIVSSGYSNDPVMSNFRDYGFDAVIAKPYKPKELYEVLQKVL
ncbi:TPA: PAS domain-containing sensor histidine kinase [bacterium]|nr:PAS domain-containing sensor histidine kinase [bacterium]